MTITQDLMTPDINTISPDASLREAVVRMNRAGNRQLPVLEDGRLVGIISDRDVRLAVNSPLLSDDNATRIRLLDEYKVEKCMTRNPLTVTPLTPVSEVAKLMALHKFGALPVLANGELVGIISTIDLLNYVAEGESETTALST